MKKVSIYGLAAIVFINVAYFIITRNGLPKINISNIKSVTISKGLVPIKQLNVDNNRAEIENLISMYNKSKRNYRNGDTTTEIDIVFQLKDGENISIQGNTQSYQYVYVNSSHYKISEKDLTNYIRSFYESFKSSK